MKDRDEIIATSITDIVRDIIVLTDSLNSKEELKRAWNEIRLALDYLSAKDSMFRSREELQKKLEEKRLDLKYPKEEKE